MKKVLFMVLLLTFSNTTFAQTKEQESQSKSKTVAFLAKDGTLLKKEYYDVEGGKVSGVGFRNIVITDLLNQNKIGALRITTAHYSSALSSTDTYIGTLDYDELSACIKSLEYMYDHVVNTTPTTYTECEYRTRDGITMSIFWNSKNTWKFVIQTKDYTNRSAQYLNIQSLSTTILNLKNSQVQLKGALGK